MARCLKCNRLVWLCHCHQPYREELELAWAAGFWEGHVGHERALRGETRDLVMTQPRHEPLERFQRAVGVGRVEGEGCGHLWRAQGEEVEHVVECLSPYLLPGG